MNKIKEFLQKHKKLLLLCSVVLICILLFILTQKNKEANPNFQVTPPSPFTLGNLTLVSSSINDGETMQTIDSTVAIEMVFSKPVDVNGVSVSITPSINLKVAPFGTDPAAIRIYPDKGPWEFGTAYHLIVENAKGLDGSMLEKSINITFTLQRPSDETTKGF